MDDIMDMVEAAADRLALYDVKEMTKEAVDLARCPVSGAEHVLGAVSGIRDLGNIAAALYFGLRALGV
jgi:uncharacterized protein Yka (UPF0111/DUF47 family)